MIRQRPHPCLPGAWPPDGRQGFLHHRAARAIAALSGCMIAMAGCHQPRQNLLVPTGPPIVWPKPPDEPRLRFLGQLTGSREFQPNRSLTQSINELFYGPTPPVMFVHPHAVAVHEDGRRVAVADTDAACVHILDLAGGTCKQETAGPDPDQRFGCPVAVAWSKDVLWVADARRHALARRETNGSWQWLAADMLKRPAGLACCTLTEDVYVTDTVMHEVLAFDAQGRQTLRFGRRGSGPGEFNCPSHIACGPDGTLVLADSLNFRVQRLSLRGEPMGMIGRKGDAAGDLALPKGVAIDREGNVWVVDAHFENVQIYSSTGQLLLAVGQEGNKPGEFWLPAGMCIDRQNRVWIADTYNRRVQVFELIGS